MDRHIRSATKTVEEVMFSPQTRRPLDHGILEEMRPEPATSRIHGRCLWTAIGKTGRQTPIPHALSPAGSSIGCELSLTVARRARPRSECPGGGRS